MWFQVVVILAFIAQAFHSIKFGKTALRTAYFSKALQTDHKFLGNNLRGFRDDDEVIRFGPQPVIEEAFIERTRTLPRYKVLGQDFSGLGDDVRFRRGHGARRQYGYTRSRGRQDDLRLPTRRGIKIVHPFMNLSGSEDDDQFEYQSRRFGNRSPTVGGSNQYRGLFGPRGPPPRITDPNYEWNPQRLKNIYEEKRKAVSLF